MVNYDGLFALLKNRGISKTTLAKKVGMSSSTLAKLAHGEYLSMKIIEDICVFLSCSPADIFSFTNDTPLSEILNVLREEKDMKLKGGLYHKTQIEMTYNSNHMEGSRLTKDQTRYIFETNTIGVESDSAINVDDITETINHFRCIDYVIDTATEILSEDIIKKLHAILKSDTSDSRKDWFAVGEYKKRPNVVGDKATASPAKVATEIAKLLDKYHKLTTVTIDDIIAFHHDFECIHPFQDGNGRVGRLIAFKECLRFNITPFIIDEDRKLFYYRGLKEWDSDRAYLLDTCKFGQDKYQAIVDYFLKTN